MFTTIIIRNKEYKLRLSTRAIIELERKLGKSPLDLLMEMGDIQDENGNVKGMIKLEPLLLITHASMQKFNTKITIEKCYDLIDDYFEENTITDLISIVMEVFKVSGFFKEEVKEEVEAVEEGK